MKISGAIFDMDGTLLDSMPLWNNIGERFLNTKGLTILPNMEQKTKTLNMPDTAHYLKEHFSLPNSEDSIINELNSMVKTGYFEVAPVKRDIVPFLAKLQEAGIAMCIATATDRYLAEAALKRTGIFKYFKFLLTCTEIGLGKENPFIFEEACRQLGTPKESTVVFEDALHAVQTASKAGFPVVAIQDDSCRNDQEEIIKYSTIFIQQYEEVIIE